MQWREHVICLGCEGMCWLTQVWGRWTRSSPWLFRVGQNVFQIPRQKGPVKTEWAFVFTAFLKKGPAGSRAARFHLFPHLSLQQLTQYYIKGRHGRWSGPNLGRNILEVLTPSLKKKKKFGLPNTKHLVCPRNFFCMFYKFQQQKKMKENTYEVCTFIMPILEMRKLRQRG